MAPKKKQQFRMTVDLSNAAFYEQMTGEREPFPEICWILEKVAVKIQQEDSYALRRERTIEFPVEDSNGNRVGLVTIT